MTPTFTLSREELVSLRKTALRRYYLSPSYIGRTLAGVKSPTMLKNYAAMGVSKLKDAMRGGVAESKEAPSS